MVETFPTRLMVARNESFGIKFEFELDHKRIYPDTLKKKVRQACKNYHGAAYFKKIVLDNPNAKGQADNGDPIEINNVGKWVFGTPGFGGHYRQDISDKTKLVIWIPKESPQIVQEMFASLTTTQILES